MVVVFMLLALGAGVMLAEAKEVELPEVVVRANQIQEDQLPAIEGANIYDGKKTQRIDLQKAPPVINNNYRHALAKTPGLLISEETTPLVSIGYRGLNPSRAQFMQVLKDGIPIHADMFGYPESYYTPALESVDHIDFVKGGASLLYGPQPGGALNYVTKDPYVKKPLHLISQNTFGSNGLFTDYTSISGTRNNIGYNSYLHHRQTQGFRDNNSQVKLFSAGAKMKVNARAGATWTFDLDGYHEGHGEPGGLTRSDFDSDITKSTRLNDRFELDRYAGAVHFDKDIDENVFVGAKFFGGFYERASWRQRSSSSAFGLVPSGGNSTTNDIENQQFYTAGAEVRSRRNYSAFGFDEHALSVGGLFYHVTSPRIDKRGNAPDAEDGVVRKDTDRSLNNVALFVENRFKFDRFTLTPGMRLENIWQSVKENINLDKTAPESQRTYDVVPLFGLGATYELSDSASVYSNVSQGFRPKIFTQAVPSSSGQVINNDLEEGKSWQAELGLRGSVGEYYSWDVSGFYMVFYDQIGTSGSTVENVGHARHEGIELANEFNLVGWWDTVFQSDYAKRFGAVSVFSNLMFLNAQFFKGPNKNLTPQYAPDYIFKTGFEYSYKDLAQVRLAGTFTDDHFANDTNTAQFSVPSYKVWDLTGEFNLIKNELSVLWGINNIFNERYYARVTSGGIDPAEGRNFYSGLKLTW